MCVCVLHRKKSQRFPENGKAYASKSVDNLSFPGVEERGRRRLFSSEMFVICGSGIENSAVDSLESWLPHKTWNEKLVLKITDNGK